MHQYTATVSLMLSYGLILIIIIFRCFTLQRRRCCSTSSEGFFFPKQCKLTGRRPLAESGLNSIHGSSAPRARTQLSVLYVDISPCSLEEPSHLIWTSLSNFLQAITKIERFIWFKIDEWRACVRALCSRMKLQCEMTAGVEYLSHNDTIRGDL